MFRSKKFNKDFEIVDEKKRYKLYKSGKNWVKASNSQLDLFRIGGMGEVVSSTLSDTEELDHAHLSFNTLAGIGGILAAGAAGFVMTQEQTVYADETSEYAEKDKTVIAAEPKAAETTETSTNSIIAQAQAEVKKAQAEQASATASVSVSQSVEAQASASQSASVSRSASASQSVSASASTSASQSTAPASASASQSTSAPVSASASAKASVSVSSTPSASASAPAPASVVESTSAVSEPSDQASVSTSASASLNLKVNPAASLVSGSANQSLASAALSASQATTTSNNIAAGVVADKNQAQGKDTTKQAEKDQKADKQVTTAPKTGYSGFRIRGGIPDNVYDGYGSYITTTPVNKYATNNPIPNQTAYKPMPRTSIYFHHSSNSNYSGSWTTADLARRDFVLTEISADRLKQAGLQYELGVEQIRSENGREVGYLPRLTIWGTPKPIQGNFVSLQVTTRPQGGSLDRTPFNFYVNRDPQYERESTSTSKSIIESARRSVSASQSASSSANASRSASASLRASRSASASISSSRSASASLRANRLEQVAQPQPA